MDTGETAAGFGGPAPSGAPAPGPPETDRNAGQGGPPFLDAVTVSLHRAADGALRLCTAAATYLRVSCYRAFPLSAPEEWVVFFDGGGAHVGVLEAVADLDEASAALCREELELRYVVPLVRDVLAVREEFAENRWNPALVWDVETERGPFRLHLPNLQDHVRPLGPGRLLLTDRDGRRCVLDPAALSGHGRALVARHLWMDAEQG